MSNAKNFYFGKESAKKLQEIKKHFDCSSDSETVRLAILKTFEGIQ